jgi:hypothetical protein
MTGRVAEMPTLFLSVPKVRLVRHVTSLLPTHVGLRFAGELVLLACNRGRAYWPVASYLQAEVGLIRCHTVTLLQKEGFMYRKMAKVLLPLVVLAVIAAVTNGCVCSIPSITTPAVTIG